jgi:magnesium chelatase subunit I
VTATHPPLESGRPAVYPFVAIVGQDDLKKSLILNVINPGLSGVLIRGEKGTAKSTAVRALAELLPEIDVVDGDPFQSDPHDARGMAPEVHARYLAGETLPVRRRRVRVVELPVSATEDRVIGTIDLETALKEGRKTIEPGLLAAANRGILYMDEVNLLDDHVVDVLLDSAAMGVNTIEREGISLSHPARFTLIGTMNPEEGELRPQLLDRFGLCVHVEGLNDPAQRVEVVKRRAAFEDDPAAFAERWADETEQTRQKIARAIAAYPHVKAPQRHHHAQGGQGARRLGRPRRSGPTRRRRGGGARAGAPRPSPPVRERRQHPRGLRQKRKDGAVHRSPPKNT